MSDYAYGGLKIRVTADTASMSQQIEGEAEKAGNKAGETVSKSIGSKLGAAAGKVGKGVATALGTGVLAFTAFGVESVKAASRVDEMNTALGSLARANGLSQEKVLGTVDALRRQGVETETAQSIVADLTKSHLGLAHATGLATVAQNASVVAGKTVSETYAQMIKGIESGNARSLRTVGIFVDAKAANQKYAESIGTTASKLNLQQKQTALLNAVMQSGKGIAGAYAASLNDPAAVLRNFPEMVKEISVSLGENLLKGFGPVIVSAGKFGRTLEEGLAPGGKLAPILTAIGTAAQQIAAPFAHIIDLASEWIDKLKPGTMTATLSTLTKFAPVFASIGSALAIFAGGKIGGDIPVIGKMLEGLGGPVGALVGGLATLALTSPVARNALGQLAGELMSGLAPILKLLMPAIGQLGAALGVLLGAAIKSLLPLVPALVQVLQLAFDVIMPLVPIIVVLVEALAKLAPIIMPIVAAYYAWVAVQWLLNAAVDANPLGLFLLALAALVGGLIAAYQHSAVFRAVVLDTWHVIEAVVLPIVHRVVAVVVDGFNLMRSAISSVMTWLRSHWIDFLYGLIAVATGPLGALVLLVVRNWAAIRSATSAALGAIQSAASNAWHGLINTASALFGQLSGVISRAWSGMVGAARNAGGSIIGGLKSGITSAVAGIGGWVKSAIVDPIVGAVKRFFGIKSPSTVMAGIGGNLIKGLFTGMVPGMSGIGNLVGKVFGGMPQALGSLVGKGIIGIAGLPGKAMTALSGLFSKGSSIVGKLGSAFGSALGKLFGSSSGSVGAGVAKWRGLMLQVLNMFGIPQLLGVFMTQMQTESGGNASAINLWDSNAAAGIPSQGLMQVVPPTFAAYAGPFRSLGILNPLANIYAAVAYAISRYGANIVNVLGHGHGYALGGVIAEPVTGVGHYSGQMYHLGEQGPELVSPLTGPAASGLAALGGGGGRTVINVYPREHQDEREIAAAVSRELAWATAGGYS